MFKSEKESDSDAYDWPDTSLGRKINALEDSMMCPICQGHYNNPQLLNCGHTFCSICIRKHFDKTLNRTSSDVCPSCREKADSADLKVNRAMASTVSLFTKLRKELFTQLNSTNDGSDSDFEILDLANVKSISRHQSGSSTVITQRIPHFSFHGMSKDKVKKTIDKLLENCRSKLRMDGDKDVLERRLREVVHLNNAQINALQPLTLDQVVRYVNERENAKEAEARKSAKTLDKIERLKEGASVEDLEVGFARLVKQARDKKAEINARNAINAVREVAAETTSAVPGSHEALLASPGDRDGVPVIPPNLNSAEVMDLLNRSYNWGPWRVVMSTKLGRPFFFNTLTGIGQFAVPPELLVVVQDEDDNEEGEGESYSGSSGTVLREDQEQDSDGPAAHVGSDASLLVGVSSQQSKKKAAQSEVAAIRCASMDVDLLFPEVDALQQSDSASGQLTPGGEEEKEEEVKTLTVGDAADCTSFEQSLHTGDERRGSRVSRRNSQSARAAVQSTIPPAVQEATVISSATQGGDSSWSCAVCTFLNSSSRRDSCEVCGTTRAVGIAISKPKRHLQSQVTSFSSTNPNSTINGSTSGNKKDSDSSNKKARKR